jgi:hypothetical protein
VGSLASAAAFMAVEASTAAVVVTVAAVTGKFRSFNTHEQDMENELCALKT